MAALSRRTDATYAIHESFQMDTEDNEDHSFCGIVFPVRTKSILPVDRIVWTNVAVRGALGPLTVWMSEPVQADENYRIPDKHNSRQWRKIYERTVQAGWDDFVTLNLTPTNGRNSSNTANNKERASRRGQEEEEEEEEKKMTDKESVVVDTGFLLDEPITLLPNQMFSVYIHSARPNDDGIVYDNTPYSTNYVRAQDPYMAVYTGCAHLSPEPFGTVPIWGYGGTAWRNNREFVGQLSYAVVYKLWSSIVHTEFPPNFRAGVRQLLLLQQQQGDSHHRLSPRGRRQRQERRQMNPWPRLPDECVYYILHLCAWDWFGDGFHPNNNNNYYYGTDDDGFVPRQIIPRPLLFLH